MMVGQVLIRRRVNFNARSENHLRGEHVKDGVMMLRTTVNDGV